MIELPVIVFWILCALSGVGVSTIGFWIKDRRDQ